MHATFCGASIKYSAKCGLSIAVYIKCYDLLQLLKFGKSSCIIFTEQHKGVVGVNRIRDLRLQKGWRQEDLAKILKTSRQAIGNYETGERGIDADTICQLCDVFGCTADYLLGRSLLPSAELSEDEAALLLAFRAADPHIQDGIRALLKPYAEETAADVS